MSEPKRGSLDEPPLEIAENPERSVVEASTLAPGVLKVKRGIRIPEVTLDQARAKLAQVDEIGRVYGGTSQGTAGGSKQKGGFGYNK